MAVRVSPPAHLKSKTNLSVYILPTHFHVDWRFLLLGNMSVIEKIIFLF